MKVVETAPLNPEQQKMVDDHMRNRELAQLPHEDFHEVWWIYAPERHPWGGLKIAHFRKTIDGTVIVLINGEIDPRRIGVRIWDDIAPREGWVKVKLATFPTRAEIDTALDAALTKIASDIKDEAGF